MYVNLNFSLEIDKPHGWILAWLSLSAIGGPTRVTEPLQSLGVQSMRMQSELQWLPQPGIGNLGVNQKGELLS